MQRTEYFKEKYMYKHTMIRKFFERAFGAGWQNGLIVTVGDKQWILEIFHPEYRLGVRILDSNTSELQLHRMPSGECIVSVGNPKHLLKEPFTEALAEVTGVSVRPEVLGFSFLKKIRNYKPHRVKYPRHVREMRKLERIAKQQKKEISAEQLRRQIKVNHKSHNK